MSYWREQLVKELTTAQTALRHAEGAAEALNAIGLMEDLAEIRYELMRASHRVTNVKPMSTVRPMKQLVLSSYAQRVISTTPGRRPKTE